MGKKNKRNRKKANIRNNDSKADKTSSSESNNPDLDNSINRSNIDVEYQEPFLIKESQKQIQGGQQKPKESIPSKDLGTISQSTLNSEISNTANLLVNLNSIKEELIKLPLNPAEKDYLDVYVFPLLNVLLDLSTTALNLSTTTGKLAVSYVTTPKTSRLKETEHLIYDIDDKCEEVYRMLKPRLNLILKCCGKPEK